MADTETRRDALAELRRLEARAAERNARFEAVAAEGERLNGPDPLGYDTDRPLHELAAEMADDALSGRSRDAVEAELARFRGRR